MSITNLKAQWVQQCPILQGDSSQGWNKLASAFSISANGNIAAVSNFSSTRGKGGLLIYQRTTNQWQLIDSILGCDHSYLGRSVFVSSDGGTIATSNRNYVRSESFPFDQSEDSFWVFKRVGVHWQQQFATPLADHQLSGISYDGNVVLTGPLVWLRVNNCWLLQDSLQVVDSLGNGYQFGNAAISGNSNTIVVGVTNYNLTGAAFVFSRFANHWVRDGNILVASGGSVNDHNQGNTVVVSGNGSVIASASTSGFCGIFKKVNNVWVQQFCTSGDTVFYNFSSNGSFNYDGNSFWGRLGNNYVFYYLNGSNWVKGIALNEPSGFESALMDSAGMNVLISRYSNQAGQMYYYMRNNNLWNYVNSIQEPTRYGGEQQGTFSAISGDGSTLAFTGSSDFDNEGAVWVFAHVGNQWIQQGPKLVPSYWLNQGATLFRKFISLSSDGNMLVVSAPDFWDIQFITDSTGAVIDYTSCHGKVYIYNRINGVWSLVQEIVNYHLISYVGMDLFNGPVAISANDSTMIICGSLGAFVYSRNGNTWARDTIFNFSTYGYTNVAISPDGGRALLVKDYPSDNYQICTRSGSQWTLQYTGTFTPYDAVNISPSYISNDGAHIAFSDFSSKGFAIYNWVGNQMVPDATPGIDVIGSRFALSSDFDTAFVFSKYDSVAFDGTNLGGPGHLSVYAKVSGRWNKIWDALPPFDFSPKHGDYEIPQLGSICVSRDLKYVAYGWTPYQALFGGALVYKRTSLNVLLSINEPASCVSSNDGKLKINISGGIPPVQISWSTGINNIDSITGLSPGTYTVTVTDADGSDLIRSYEVLQRSHPSLNSIELIEPCHTNDGFIILNVSEGTPPYSYLWSTNPVQTGDTAISLTMGLYGFTITDSFGCITSDSIELGSDISWTSTTSAQPNCGNNGNVAIVMNGGVQPYSYLWSTGDTTPVVNLLGAGIYTATITDGNGCNVTGTAILNPYCGNVICGNVFFDKNNNCSRDSAEGYAIRHNIFASNGNYISYGTTDSIGNYEIVVPTSGSFSVSINYLTECAMAPCNSLLYPVPVNFTGLGDTVFNVNIPLIDTGYDLSLQALAPFFAPGSNTNYIVYYGNLRDSIVTSGTIRMNYDTNLVVNYAQPPFSSIDTIAGEINWSISNIGPLYPLSQNVSVSFYTPSGLGVHSEIRSTIFPLNGDCNTQNNSILTGYVSSGNGFPVDPNMKVASPEDVVASGDSSIEYTIYFQNTGTDSTHFVIVSDTLSNLMDASSIQTLATSHLPYVFSLEGQGIVQWRFEPMFLPDSSTDEVNSHGYVKFRVQLKHGLTPQTQISNTAFICFDYQNAVATNTVTNTIGCPSSVAEFSANICSGFTYNFNGQNLDTSGNYNAIFQNASGCDSNVILHLFVIDTFIHNLSASICTGSTYSFNGQNLNNEGDYFIVLQNVNGCDSIIHLSLAVDSVISLVHQMGEDTLVADGSGSVQWIECNTGVIVSGAVNSTFIPSVSGSYQAVLSNGNCTDTSACLQVIVNGIINEDFGEFSLFPNPSMGLVHILMSSSASYILKLFDVNGSLLSFENYAGRSKDINVELLSSGIYIVEVAQPGKAGIRKKLIKIN